MTVDEATRTYVQTIVDSVPTRSGDLNAVVRRGGHRRRLRNASMVVGGLLAIVVAVAPLFTLASGPDPMHIAGSRGDTYLVLSDGYEVPVEPEPVESRGALVYLGSLGPEPAFDTSALGTEVMFERQEASHLVVPSSSNPLERNALRASVLVYLGDIETAQLALNVLDTGEVCIFFGNGTDVTGGGYCPVTDRPQVGTSSDPVVDGWLVWSQLPKDAAVVQITLPDGTSYWQRPVARTSFFQVADPDTLAAARLVALDADGKVLIRDEATFLEGHENWKDPLGRGKEHGDR
ncbi:MAG: hypothetical protein R2823_08690 [Acidimicrobiia bacterium]